MKINQRSKPIYAIVDAINGMSWVCAATSITTAGLLILWGIGSFFILLSV